MCGRESGRGACNSLTLAAIIVYTMTKDAEKAAEVLRHAHVKADAYHAGMEMTDRRRVHEEFLDEKLTGAGALGGERR